MDENIYDINRRMYELESRTALIEQTQKHFDEKINNKFSEIKKDVQGVKDGINRVLWALGFVLISAVGQFIISGGLNL